MKNLKSLFAGLLSLAVVGATTVPQQAHAFSFTETSASTADAPARPHGCLAYGAMGAVAGHFVRSGHSVMGAMAGCSYGLWQRHKWKKAMKSYDGQKRSIITNSSTGHIVRPSYLPQRVPENQLFHPSHD